MSHLLVCKKDLLSMMMAQVGLMLMSRLLFVVVGVEAHHHRRLKMPSQWPHSLQLFPPNLVDAFGCPFGQGCQCGQHLACLKNMKYFKFSKIKRRGFKRMME
jgi:hypothetical protein